jgi:uncharacterized protein (TIGR02646 family)
MKLIDKNRENEPKSLRIHRMKSFSNYDNFVEKDELRVALLAEQGYICCYCMQRIQTPTPDKMKIEHFLPQHEYPDKQLDYTNLLASCKGDEWSSLKDFHCDKSKSEKVISLNPSSISIIEQIYYGRNGQFCINDQNFQNESNEVLNLNVPSLMLQRRGIYHGVTLFLKKEFGDKKPTKSVLHKKIKLWLAKKNGKFEPFCAVAVYFLTRALKNTQ